MQLAPHIPNTPPPPLPPQGSGSPKKRPSVRELMGLCHAMLKGFAGFVLLCAFCIFVSVLLYWVWKGGWKMIELCDKWIVYES